MISLKGHSAAHSGTTRRKSLVPIAAILLLAAALRIINAGHFPVWTDEGWGTWAASDHTLGVILDKVAHDRHPPLYFVALSGWWTLAGDSRIALRFLSIASGLLTVAVVYRIGADWFHSSDRSSAARFSALILAVLPTAIYYSQDLRDYGWLTLGVALMTLFFLRYMRHPRRITGTAYALSTAFMLYTLYIGVLILAVQGVVGILFWRGTRRAKLGLIAAWIAAAVLYVPWLIVLIGQLNILSSGIYSYPSTLEGTLLALVAVLGPQTALMGALVTLGAWHMLHRLHRAKWPLAFITLLLSSVVLFGAMLAINTRFGLLAARILVFLTPFFALVGGYGLSRIAPQSRRVFAAALVLLLIIQPGTVQPRLDYQVAAREVAAGYTPGDLIVLETGWDDNAFRYELMLALGESAAPDIVRTLPWVDNRDPNQPVLPQVIGAIRSASRIWVINWLQPAQVMPFLDQGGDGFTRVVSRQTATGSQYKALYTDDTVRIALYERPPTLSASTARIYSDLFSLDGSLVAMNAAPNSRLQVDLWWSALKSLSRDYSVGVFLMDANGVVQAQQDGPPGGSPTSAWTLHRAMFDRHTLSLLPNLPPGTYRVGVAVYWYGDGKRLSVNGNDSAIVATVTVR